MKRENFYRRDPSKALSGMIGLSLEERGVYNTVLDLLYSTWLPLEDDRAFIANWCGCAVQKINPIIRRLIERGRLITFTENGRTYLSDEAFEVERKAVKGGGSTRSGRAEVGEKSAGVREKSAGVEENLPLLDTDVEEKRGVTPLEKNREEKSRSSEANASSEGAGVRAIDDDPFALLLAVWPASALDHTDVPAARTAFAAQAVLVGDPMRLVEAGRACVRAPSTKARSVPLPGLHRWLERQMYLGRLKASAAQGLGEGEAGPSGWDGPPEVWAEIVRTCGGGFARSYLAPCRWEATTRTVVPPWSGARTKLLAAWEPLKSKGFVLGEVSKKGVA
jgi:hypothetical protein